MPRPTPSASIADGSFPTTVHKCTRPADGLPGEPHRLKPRLQTRLGSEGTGSSERTIKSSKHCICGRPFTKEVWHCHFHVRPAGCGGSRTPAKPVLLRFGQ